MFWAELFKAGLRWPTVSARFEFRFESLKSISVLVLFVYKLMIGSSKNNRENFPRKCFRTQEQETRVKFNPGLSANRPSNNWALHFKESVSVFVQDLKDSYIGHFYIILIARFLWGTLTSMIQLLLDCHWRVSKSSKQALLFYLHLWLSPVLVMIFVNWGLTCTLEITAFFL